MKDNKVIKGIVIIGGLILILSLIFSSKYDYEILKEEQMRKEKLQLDIGLKNKITKKDLDGIVKEIHDENNDFERIFIWFHLSNDMNKKPWAVSVYSDNKLKTTVTATIEVEKNLKSINVDYDIIGKWYEEEATTASSIIFYKKDNKIFKLSTYHDLSNSILELETQNNITFNYKEDFHGEYFKIESNGNLGLYNKENEKFIEAERF